ncbi:methylaspartate mutase [Saccharothrix coeruleofusca]|uniref:Methylaspartate mutase n=1 Tax=Saccharothrix coeruleofusca TaxID=33919 RepID=A0A918AR75_9PSEU|nr:methylaspartate mutase [Saccharothrix coeruleofusca]
MVTSTASDSHTWNLVYLQLTIEEAGHRVHNLGACVPDDEVVDECLRRRPDLLVVSSVNGHGFTDGLRLITALRSCDDLRGLPVVIGGKLGICGTAGVHGELLEAGYDALFEDDPELARFRGFLDSLVLVRR